MSPTESQSNDRRTSDEDKTELCQSSEFGSTEARRTVWSNKLEFLLSCIGYSIGLGNVWRFPYLCYTFGGGKILVFNFYIRAFLIPYFIFLVFCGMPLYLLELCFGQYGGLSPTAAWTKFCPLFQGLGWCMVLVSAICCVYYNVIMAWTLYYLGVSFTSSLPWLSCNESWSHNSEDEICVATVKERFSSLNNSTRLDGNNSFDVTNLTKRSSASEQFWIYRVLQLSQNDLTDLGPVRWQLALALFASWVLIFGILCKSVATSGKVVYLTAPFPYVLMLVLLIRAAMLEGAGSGIRYLFKPQWHHLRDPKVWLAAASQIFYSTGGAWGGLITMASFNRPNYNCFREGLAVPVINAMSSLLAASICFMIIGHVSHVNEVDISHMVSVGAGLAFVIYPEAIGMLPVAPLWSVLFFLMLLLVGIDTQFGMMETVMSGLTDYFQVLRPHHTKVVAVICLLMFLLGLPFVTKGGMYLLQLVDWYNATMSFFIIAICECVATMYCHGIGKFSREVYSLVKIRVPLWFQCCWVVFTPLSLLLILCFSCAFHSPVKYRSYSYPDWALAVGWCISLVSLVPLIGYAGGNTARLLVSGKAICDVIKPHSDWYSRAQEIPQ